VQADAGQIQWNGREVVIANPSEARRLGIGMVFQHFSLFETLSVVENIALALDEPFDLKGLAARVKEVLPATACPWTRTAWCTACRWASASGSRSCAACCSSPSY
jgi:ABC-type uncharacterized transport system ATPase subunit